MNKDINMNLTKELASKESAWKVWLSAIPTDIVVYGSLFLWLFNGVEGAGNVFKVVLWACFVMVTITALLMSDKKVSKPSFRPKGFTTYHYLTDALALLALAWFGHFLLTSIFIAKFTLYEAIRSHAVSQLNTESKSNKPSNLVTMEGDLINFSDIASLKEAQLQLGIDTEIFDLENHPLEALKEFLNNNSIDAVVLGNGYFCNLKELYGIFTSFPNVKFFLTLNSKEKSLSIPKEVSPSNV